MASVLLESVQFEHWLRFHFLQLRPGVTENGNTGEEVGILKVSPAWVETCEKKHKALFPMLLALQDQEITLEKTRSVVFAHIASCMGLVPADPAFGEKLTTLIEDPNFCRSLDAFHAWVQELAEEDMAKTQEQKAQDEIPSFAKWKDSHAAWAKAKGPGHVTGIPKMEDIQSSH